MSNWGHDKYPVQHGMGMNNGPLLPLPTPMYSMPNVTPMNPPPPVPLHLLNQPRFPDPMNQESEMVTQETETSRSSREQPNSQRRDRDRSARRSQDNDFNRYDKSDRQDKNKGRFQRQSKWDNGEKEPLGPIDGIGPNIQGHMMLHPGLGSYQNMMANNIIASNMMHMPNMMMHQSMEQNQMPSMMSPMNMMNNMMPNMIDQNIIMNQQMMHTMANQPMYISAGVIIPPVSGAEATPRREKPKGCRTIFVAGLPKGVSIDVVNEIFGRFGPIDDIKFRNGAFYVRFQNPQCVEQSFVCTGYRFKLHKQSENEATTIYVDYASNRDDLNEYDKEQRLREPTPPPVELFTTAALSNLTEKIKIENEFPNFAPTLAAWLERGECTKKNANTFYSLIQVSNNQSRRLFNEKMQLDDELHSLRASFRKKFAHVLLQLEQVAKILSVAKHQRVSDHFTKQQRRNIDMWLKMTEEVENIKEEFQILFDEDDTEKIGKNVVALDKYEKLKMENESLAHELEGYKNEAHLVKEESERKFETFKAHFIAQQALQNKQQVYPPLPSTPNAQPHSVENDCHSPHVVPTEAKLISILTAFLMVHPLGASIDYLTSYVKSLTPNVAEADVLTVLRKYEDVFQCKITGVGASIDHKWTFATFDTIKDLH